MSQMLLRIDAVTDRVFVQIVSEATYCTVEMELNQADTMQAALQKAIGKAKAFVPGEKSFVDWGV